MKKRGYKRSIIISGWVRVIFFVMFVALPCHARTTTFTESASLKEEYDSNIYLDSSNPHGSWLSTLLLSSSLVSKGSSDNLNLLYDLGFTVDNDNFDYRRITHKLGLTANKSLSAHLNFRLQESLTRSDDPLDESLDQLLTRIRGRSRYWVNSAATDLAYEYAKASTLELGYKNDILNNDASDREDSIRHNPYVGLKHRFTPKWLGELTYGYIKGLFDRSDDLFEHKAESKVTMLPTIHDAVSASYSFSTLNYDGSGREDYRLHDGLLMWDRKLTPHTEIALGSGASLWDREVSGDIWGFRYGLTLQQRLKRFMWSVGGLGGLAEQQFSSTNNGVVRFWSGKGDISYQWMSYLTSRISCSVRENEFLEQIPEEKEKTYQAGLTTSYALSPRSSAEMGYTFRQADSTLDEMDYIDHRVFLQYTIKQELWRN